MEKEDTSDVKHLKYFNSYKPNDIFWGIGIENETYIEIKDQPKVKGSFLQDNHKRERYSLDYYDTYLNKFFNKTIDKLTNRNEDYELPVLINAHYLTKCDAADEHKTVYSREIKPNPKFSGHTRFEDLKTANPYFEKEEGNSYCFDGDTLEFMTLNFYKANIYDVISELKAHKSTFMKNLLAEKHTLCKGNENLRLEYPKKNHGFARMATNKGNLAIFNNGTYHFNVTLPTQLDPTGEIANFKDFEMRHKKAIRLIQFMEPFFIAKFGSGDPLADKKNEYYRRFPRGSQRCAASRYISIGTYDTVQMKKGKLLQEDRIELSKRWPDNHWYNQLYSQINYKKGEKIGFDINFNKFKNHGIEIRFFDWFPEEHLENVLRCIVHLLDLSESMDKIPGNPILSSIWHELVYTSLLEGCDAVLKKGQFKIICDYLNICYFNPKSYPYTYCMIYDEISKELEKKFGSRGPVSKYMIPQQSVWKTITGYLSVLCRR
jgi:hypothetical protein